MKRYVSNKMVDIDEEIVASPHVPAGSDIPPMTPALVRACAASLSNDMPPAGTVGKPAWLQPPLARRKCRVAPRVHPLLQRDVY